MVNYKQKYCDFRNSPFPHRLRLLFLPKSLKTSKRTRSENLYFLEEKYSKITFLAIMSAYGGSRYGSRDNLEDEDDPRQPRPQPRQPPVPQSRDRGYDRSYTRNDPTDQSSSRGAPPSYGYVKCYEVPVYSYS